MVTTARSYQDQTMTLRTYSPQQMSLPRINFLHLSFQNIATQNFNGHGPYGKVKSRSNHDIAYLHPQTNVPTKYQYPTSYGFRDTSF